MKQNITVEQLKQCSDFIIKKMGLMLGYEKINSNAIWQAMAQDITIGKMIEILEEREEYPQIHLSQDIDWAVEIESNIVAFVSKELCDALWEAVKFVLEEK